MFKLHFWCSLQNKRGSIMWRPSLSPSVSDKNVYWIVMKFGTAVLYKTYWANLNTLKIGKVTWLFYVRA